MERIFKQIWQIINFSKMEKNLGKTSKEEALKLLTKIIPLVEVYL